MAERASDSIRITASTVQVRAAVMDLESYPDWAEGVKTVTITERDADGRPVLAAFQVDARVAIIEYVLRYSYEDPNALTWTLEESDVLRQLDGSYGFDEQDGVTEVTYSLTVEAQVPIPAFLKKRATKAVLEASLRGLKDRVEGQT